MSSKPENIGHGGRYKAPKILAAFQDLHGWWLWQLYLINFIPINFILDKENNGLGLVRLIYLMLRHSHKHGHMTLYSILNIEVKIKQGAVRKLWLITDFSLWLLVNSGVSWIIFSLTSTVMVPSNNHHLWDLTNDLNFATLSVGLRRWGETIR